MYCTKYMQWSNVQESEYADIATQVLDTALVPHSAHATVLALSGTLGAGKTTFARALARALGITQHIKSPTFIIESRYPLGKSQGDSLLHWKEFVHIDAYRLDNTSNLEPLKLVDTFAQPNTLVLVEWPEHIEAAMPKHTISMRIDIVGEGRNLTVVE